MTRFVLDLVEFVLVCAILIALVLLAGLDNVR